MHLVFERKQKRIISGDILSGEVQLLTSKQAQKEEIMMKLEAFQTAAREGGFVAEIEMGEGTVQWLRKIPSHMARDTHQRMCIDTMTNSVTLYWVGDPGKLNSKTFRDVPALQEWFQLEPRPIVQR
jgi:hypothetical protein